MDFTAIDVGSVIRTIRGNIVQLANGLVFHLSENTLPIRVYILLEMK